MMTKNTLTRVNTCISVETPYDSIFQSKPFEHDTKKS